MKTYLISLMLLFILILVGMSFADDFVPDESLFNDDSFEVASNEVVQNGSVSDEERSVFSGGMHWRVTETMLSKDSNETLATSIGAFLLADIHLKEGIKAFAHLETAFDPIGIPVSEKVLIDGSNVTLIRTNHLIYGLKEIFMDLNLNKKIFFRAGKQVLQWGRGVFWNPTDLINLERKDFNDLSVAREGGYGFKVMIPVETVFNFYGYLDANGVSRMKDLALSLKGEMLIGQTEVAVSARIKRGERSAFGLDFSSNLWNWHFYGESLFLSEVERLRFVSTNVIFGTLTNETEVAETETLSNTWIPKICIGLSRSFDLFDVTDRVSFTLEGYYNGAGYTNLMLDTTTRQALFVGGGYYQPNDYGQWYGAFFISVRELLWKDLTGSLNGLANFSDGSGMLAFGLTASPVDHFSLAWNVTGRFGEDQREYTFADVGLSAGFVATLLF